MPDTDYIRRFEAAIESGFDAIEIHGTNTWTRRKDILEAVSRGGVFSNISAGYTSCPADISPLARKKFISSFKVLLEFAAEIKSKGVIAIPLWAVPYDPLAAATKTEIQEENLVEIFSGLGEYAGKLGVKVFIEPVNRYESPVFNTLDETAGLIRKAANENVKLLADFFHMNIEEASISESIERNFEDIGLMHIADSNRLLPGQGHIDYRKPFSVLKKNSFTGYISFECRGKINPAQFAGSVKYVREQYLKSQ